MYTLIPYFNTFTIYLLQVVCRITALWFSKIWNKCSHMMHDIFQVCLFSLNSLFFRWIHDGAFKLSMGNWAAVLFQNIDRPQFIHFSTCGYLNHFRVFTDKHAVMNISCTDRYARYSLEIGLLVLRVCLLKFFTW